MTGSALGRVDALVIGGGRMVHHRILPVLYHLQREGLVRVIKICDVSVAPLRALAESPVLRQAFPDQSFVPYPSWDTPPEVYQPELFRQALAEQRERQLVVVAVPDPLHGPVIRAALESQQHVLCLAPLVRSYREAQEIAQEAYRRGLLVAVDHPMRWDPRVARAQFNYRQGHLGNFRLGGARRIVPYDFRHGNLQSWFGRDHADPFSSFAIDDLDAIHFITGLRPVEVAVRGVEGSFPNGNVGFLWAVGRVVWENGAVLSVLAGVGFPGGGPPAGDHSLLIYGERQDGTGLIRLEGSDGTLEDSLGAKTPMEIGCLGSADALRLVPWEEEGLKPVGYAYDSLVSAVQAVLRVNLAGAGLAPEDALAARQRRLLEIDSRALLATAASSVINVLVAEAGRMSILNTGIPVEIRYDGSPQVAIRSRG